MTEAVAFYTLFAIFTSPIWVFVLGITYQVIRGLLDPVYRQKIIRQGQILKSQQPEKTSFWFFGITF